MTRIIRVILKCPDCSTEWDAYLGTSTNTFGMNEEQAREHLTHFKENYVSPHKKPCPECGSTTEKQFLKGEDGGKI